jgi:type VII secretion protein EccB
MRSRREQVEAHRFITSRMNLALVLANPDSTERPLRRIGVSIFASAMVMTLVFGGFALAALLNKGTADPEPGNIIVERDSNSVYLAVLTDPADETSDIMLIPVQNYTSALLLVQPHNGEPPVQRLKASSLAKYQRGHVVGIPNAPATPPPSDSLLQEDRWNVCSMPVRDRHSLLLAQVVVADLPQPNFTVDKEHWLFAVTEDENEYLVWEDRKFPIPDRSVYNILPNVQFADAMPVKQAVMDSIISGPPLEFLKRPEFGTLSDTLINGVPAEYGKTVEVSDNYYVLIAGDDGDEFAPITKVMQLLSGEVAETITTGDLNDVGAQGEIQERIFPTDPADVEVISEEGRRVAVCAIFDPAADEERANLSLNVYERAPAMLTEAAEAVSMNSEGEIVEGHDPQIVVEGGKAVLVAAQIAPGNTLYGFRWLVDDIGVRYGIIDSGFPTGTTQRLLGYADIEPVGVPDSILALIPVGPELDPYQARQQLDPAHRDATYDSGEGDGADAEGEGGDDLFGDEE